MGPRGSSVVAYGYGWVPRTSRWDHHGAPGLLIRVGVHDVQVVPQYEDVDHAVDGDNDYVLNNPNDDEDRRQFRQVVDSFCR